MPLRNPNFYLRKHRKCPHLPYKAKWDQTFTQQEALRTFKSSLQHHPNNPLSSLLHSFKIYNSNPTPQAYHLLLRFLYRTSQLHHIPQVLDHLETRRSFEIPESIFVDLIKFYGKCGRIQDALHLFDRMPKIHCSPSVDSLDALIAVLCRSDEGLKWVPGILMKSKDLNIRVEESTFKVLITALCRLNRVGYAIEMFNTMVNDGFGVDPGICNLLMESLCKGRGLYSGAKVMGFLGELRMLGFCPGSADYKKLLEFLVEGGMGMEALDVLNRMKSDGIKPDIGCYNMVLSAVVEVGAYLKADELFDELLVFGLVPDAHTYNAYIKCLCKLNKVQDGLRLVVGMDELGCKPDLITYNALVEGLCMVGDISRSKELLREMESNGVMPSLVTYRNLIDVLSKSGQIIEACALLEEALDRTTSTTCLTFDEILCGLCQMGLICKALELLQKMVDKNVSLGAKGWEALIYNSKTEISFVDTTLIGLLEEEQRAQHA